MTVIVYSVVCLYPVVVKAVCAYNIGIRKLLLLPLNEVRVYIFPNVIEKMKYLRLFFGVLGVIFFLHVEANNSCCFRCYCLENSSFATFLTSILSILLQSLFYTDVVVA